MAMLAFAQFGGGTGTESDSYRIYTVAHLEEIGDSLDNGNYLYDKHFRLMNDIVDDSLTNMIGDYYGSNQGFCGSLHGGGHTVALNMQVDYGHDAALFYNIGTTDVYGNPDGRGYVDSLTVVGVLYLSESNQYIGNGSGICMGNSGTIYRCVSKLQISNISFFGGIAGENRGNIISCTNYTSTTYPAVGGICYMARHNSNIIDCKNYGKFKINGEATAGICALSEGANIIGCTNYGNFSSDQSAGMQYSVGGIVGQFMGGPSDDEYQGDLYITRKSIANCQNLGTIDAQLTSDVGGIVGYIDGNVSIERCENYGNVYGLYNVGGIAGRYAGDEPGWITGVGYTCPKGRLVNCYNSGQIYGDSIVGGIAGTFASRSGDTIAHCLNIGRVDGSAICSGHYAFNDDDYYDWGDSIYYDSNYYDAQMLAYNADNEEGMYERKLTSQLTGDTPQLRAMLGDGWSYAEGRYPIPLGLENDSLAMLFATPIYLYAESADDYDDVDLVQHHFIVGTENEVSWESGSRLSIVGENATILASGSENITASLAGYSFTRNLNLINPVNIEEQEFDDVKISPNPTSDILNIKSSETISEIEILNVMGQVVKHIEVNADNAVCNVEDLTSGVYVVKIYSRPFAPSANAQGANAQGAAISQRKFVKE